MSTLPSAWGTSRCWRVRSTVQLKLSGADADLMLLKVSMPLLVAVMTVAVCAAVDSNRTASPSPVTVPARLAEDVDRLNAEGRLIGPDGHAGCGVGGDRRVERIGASDELVAVLNEG